MRRFHVTGMSCAACSARVEKAVSRLSGVTSCSVNLLTGEMSVEGTVSDEQIVDAVTKAGYGVENGVSSGLSGGNAGTEGPRQKGESAFRLPSATGTEETEIRKRLIISLVLLVPIMYLSMGIGMFGAPSPAFLRESEAAKGILEMLLAFAVMFCNRRFFQNGVRGLRNLAPNMDTLVALGSSASFLYSTAVLLRYVSLLERKLPCEPPAYYFESSAMILTLISVGKLLEARSKGKTTDALRRLLELAPETARVLRDGKEETVPVSEVKKGDLFVVRPGEAIPADGIVTEGVSSVNEAALTGESIPVDKEKGSEVSAATINTSGRLICRAERTGEDTALFRIIRLVTDATTTKAPAARLADQAAGIFVPTVIGISVLTFLLWYLKAGAELGFAIGRAVSVLVISCPCALGLATPVAIMVGSGVGARNGILFKAAEALEQTGKCRILALDKTGTVTAGEPAVTGIFPAEGVTKEELLQKAASLESFTSHPLGKAVCARYQGKLLPAENFENVTGSGLRAELAGRVLLGGNAAFIRKETGVGSQTEETLSESDEIFLQRMEEMLSSEGKTALVFAEGKRLLGVIAVADEIRRDSAKAVSEMKKLGIEPVMLTGDSPAAAAAIAQKAGIERVFAGLRPENKEEKIRELRKTAPVLMVGDGINDAPALTAADIGAAIGAGTNIAVDSADVVLMKSTLLDAAAAVRLSRAVLKNIRQNLFWAFFYNILGIPLAAGLFSRYGWNLSPSLCAAMMSFSSFFVVTNALRLNGCKIYMEGKIMQAEWKVTGMMCPHCEARVVKTVSAMTGIQSVKASHQENRVWLEYTEEADLDAVKAAIEKEGYEVG